VTLNASTWLNIAEPEEKQTLYDEIKKVVSAPEVVSALYEILKKEAEEEGVNFEEFQMKIPYDAAGENLIKFLMQWLKGESPDAQKFIDSLVEKVEISPSNRSINVSFRIPKKT
jgi:hypothetical protein